MHLNRAGEAMELDSSALCPVELSTVLERPWSITFKRYAPWNKLLLVHLKLTQDNLLLNSSAQAMRVCGTFVTFKKTTNTKKS